MGRRCKVKARPHMAPVALHSVAQASLIKAGLIPFSVSFFELLTFKMLRLLPPEQVAMDFFEKRFNNLSTAFYLVLVSDSVFHRHDNSA